LLRKGVMNYVIEHYEHSNMRARLLQGRILWCKKRPMVYCFHCCMLFFSYYIEYSVADRVAFKSFKAAFLFPSLIDTIFLLEVTLGICARYKKW